MAGLISGGELLGAMLEAESEFARIMSKPYQPGQGFANRKAYVEAITRSPDEIIEAINTMSKRELRQLARAQGVVSSNALSKVALSRWLARLNIGLAIAETLTFQGGHPPIQRRPRYRCWSAVAPLPQGFLTVQGMRRAIDRWNRWIWISYPSPISGRLKSNDISSLLMLRSLEKAIEGAANYRHGARAKRKVRTRH